MEPIDQAHATLRMTPQERGLYERHLANLQGSGKVQHDNGAISTLYQLSTEGPDGTTYNIPSVYQGSIVTPEQAVMKAEQQGWYASY